MSESNLVINMANKKYKTLDEYIASFPEDIKDILGKIRETIRESAHEAEETINYGIPTFKLKGMNLIHFAAFKRHIGLYPTPSTIEALKKDLASYEISKGTIKFPYSKPIPFTLVKDIVKFRVNEVLFEDKK